jgi:hypothetical protein
MRAPARTKRRPEGVLAARVAIGLVALAAILSCYPFVAPGHPATVDTWPHLARQSLVYNAIKGGFSPFYTFMFYSGFPALRFYSPLFYFLSGPLTLLTEGNLLLALRILLVVLHVLSAFVMYVCLLRRETGESAREKGTALAAATQVGRFGPALGAIAYLVVPWRTVYLAGLANYPQSLVYVLLPLVFLALESFVGGSTRQERGTRVRQGLLLGLWVGLLFLSHLVYAIYALLFLAIWWVTMAKRTAGEWRALGAAALAGIGVSAFFLVPFVAEQASHRFPITHLNLGVPNWLVLLGLKSRIGGYAGNYLGLSVVILLAVAIGAVILVRRFRFQVPAMLGLAISLFLTFGPALLKEKQYLITAGLPPERFLVFVIFFIALLVPSGFALVRDALSERRIRPAAVFGVMAIAIMLDCLLVVCRFHRRNPSEFLTVREEIYPVVRSEPHARLLDLNIPESKIDDPRRTNLFPTVGVIYGGLPTPLGLPYHQYAPRSMLYVYPWVDYAVMDLGNTDSQPISENTHKVLALLGASHIITLPALLSSSGTDSGPFSMLLKNGIDWDDGFVAAGREPPLAFGHTDAGLVLAANRTVPMAPDKLVADHSFIVARDWQRLLDTLQIDEQNHSLNFIPALAGTKPESMPGRPTLSIDSTKIRHPDVVTGFRASADCFLRVAISYYPELELRLDGKPVPFFETADHFIYIRCPAGSHVLSVKARLGGLRIATLLLSLVSLPVVVVLILRRKGTKPTNPQPAKPR